MVIYLIKQTLYIPLPANKDIQSLNDLQFWKIFKIILIMFYKKGLKSWWYKNADIGIFILWISGQKLNIERNIPIYGQTGISSSTANGTIINTSGI